MGKNSSKAPPKKQVAGKKLIKRSAPQPALPILPPEPPKVGRRKLLLQFAAFVLTALAVVSYLQLQSPNLLETDEFYHLHHAALYLQQGLFMSDFPWIITSVIRTYASDIWYGFHILLIPFTFIQDPALQIKVAGIFTLTMAMLMLFIAARRTGAAFPYLWPFVWVFSSGLTTSRLAMVRPHILSVGLTALVFAFMLEGSVYGVLFASTALTFIHLSFFWLPILVVFVTAAIKFASERVFEWRKLIATLAGVILGWLLRPNPIGALKILNVQIAQLLFQKQAGVLGFAQELRPVPAEILFKVIPAFFILWCCAAVIFIVALCLRRPLLSPRQRTALWASLALSTIFFAMILKMSMRSIDMWAPFATLFCAFSFSNFLLAREAGQRLLLPFKIRKVVAALLLLLMVYAGWASLAWYRDIMARGIPPQRMKAAAEWLKNYTNPEDVVVNTDTDAFGELSFWGADNRFVMGMDVIFTYSYDEKLFYKIANWMRCRLPGQTWDTPSYDPSRVTDAYSFLSQDLNASYIVVREKYQPRLYGWARSDSRLSLRFDEDDVAIFKVMQ